VKFATVDSTAGSVPGCGFIRRGVKIVEDDAAITSQCFSSQRGRDTIVLQPAGRSPSAGGAIMVGRIFSWESTWIHVELSTRRVLCRLF